MQMRPEVKQKFEKAVKLVEGGMSVHKAAAQAGTYPQLLRKQIERERPDLRDKVLPRKVRTSKKRTLHETVVVQNSPIKDHVYFVSGPADVVEKLLGVLK